MKIYKRYKNKWRPKDVIICDIYGSLYLGDNVNIDIDYNMNIKSEDKFIYIGNNTKIGRDYFLGANTIIGSNCEIGRNATLHQECKLKNNCKIGIGVYMEKNVMIGNRCYVNNYTTIYRFAKLENNVYVAKNAAIAPGAEIPAYSTVYSIIIGKKYLVSIYYNSYIKKIEFTFNSRETSYYDINMINKMAGVKSTKLKEIANKLKERYKL